MAREFFYKGKTVEQLQKMPLEELLTLFNARARRLIRRSPMQYRELLSKVAKAKKKNAVLIKTRFRSAVILPDWVGLRFGVHNGKQYVDVQVTPVMVGKRLGEYSHTTGKVVHSGPGVGATRSSKFVPLK